MSRFLHAPDGGSSHEPSGQRALRSAIRRAASPAPPPSRRSGPESRRPPACSGPAARRTLLVLVLPAGRFGRAAAPPNRTPVPGAPAPQIARAGQPPATGPELPPAPGAGSPPGRRQSGKAMGVDDVGPGERRRGPPPAARGLQAFLSVAPCPLL